MVHRSRLVLVLMVAAGCKAPVAEPVAPPPVDSPRVPQLGDQPAAAPGPDEIIDVSAGVDSTCVVMGDGAVLCVGAGAGVDVGPDGESVDIGTPRRIEGIPPMVEVEAGDGLWCARSAKGEVYCWQRYNVYEEEDVTVPKPVALAAPALELVVRGGFACARTESAIECWPDFGRLPLDFSYDSWALVTARGGHWERMELCFTRGGAAGCTERADDEPVVQVPDRARALHSLLDHDEIGSDARCWLEPGGTLDCRSVLDGKLSVPDGARLHVTGSNACWHTDDGRLYCTGDNRNGQLGRAGVESLLGATHIEGVPPLAQVSVGSNHLCALTHDRRLWCWGRAAEGQLGHAVGVASATPVRADVEGVERVVAGGDRTCVRTSEGWRCSGFLEGQECGRATMSLPLPGVEPDAEVLLGGFGLCVRKDAMLQCVRASTGNSLHSSSVFEPRDHRIYFDEAVEAPGAVVLLDEHVCVQDRKGRVGCDDERSWKPGKKLDALVGGAWHMCGLRRDAEVECADRIDYEGTVQDLGLRARPQQISLYGDDLCVLASDTVHCFAAADRERAIIPLTIEGLPAKAKSVAVGRSLACVLGHDGTVACWDLLDGVQAYYEPETFTARDMPLPEPAVELAVGLRHACARTASGALYCWGDDHAGQLGDGAALCDFTPADVTDAFSQR